VDAAASVGLVVMLEMTAASTWQRGAAWLFIDGGIDAARLR
jgi:hypothetical protein